LQTAEERYYLEGEGDLVVQFAQEWIVQTKGRWAGTPLKMEPWQRDFLNELFLVYDDGERVYREALLGISRKNGKSTLSAAIALYLLLAAGEEGPEVYAAAASKDQARIVFRQAIEFVESSPRLRDWLTPQKDVIICKANNGIFRVLAADAPKQYGLNPYGVVIDELWAHANPELYFALTTGQLAREDPLIVNITTAGFDKDSICYQLYERGKHLLEDGGIEALRKAGFLFRWYEAPPTASVKDMAGWEAANPSSWIKAKDLEREAERLPEPVFRRLHLNQWTEAEDSWIKPWMWAACKGLPVFDPTDDSYMAVDVGFRKDSAAILWGQWHGDKLHIGQLILLPEDMPDSFGIADIRAALASKARQNQRVKDIPFDPWQFRESAEILMEDHKLPMTEFPQGSSRMGPASETLYELIKDGRIVHDGDREARKQLLAAVASPTERGGMMISKRKSLERIDFAVSLAMLADRAVTLRYEKPQRRGAAFF
jgi:phage terminase large subunit-like protein